ncbi:MAG TPA: phage tail protein [Acetobacteraceae bacterium]|jgi:phage tail-like protein|nr:phage tail protein [Acetobacteraceae bacterium]
MAETTAIQKTTYPLPAYNFRVTVDGQSASFAEASGLAIEYETVTYRHGFSAWEGETITRFRALKHVPLSLKKGTVAGNTLFGDWLGASPTSARAIGISLCDEAGAPVVVWRIAEAIPTKLSAPTFDASTNQVSIETLDLLVSGISVEHV